MNKQKIIFAFLIATFSIATFAVSNQQNSAENDVKSVAWYTANVPDARKKNKECYDNPKLQPTKNCKNSLHALKIVYVGVGN
jgi:hypothetical protein